MTKCPGLCRDFFICLSQCRRQIAKSHPIKFVARPDDAVVLQKFVFRLPINAMHSHQEGCCHGNVQYFPEMTWIIVKIGSAELRHLQRLLQQYPTLIWTIEDTVKERQASTIRNTT